MQFQPGGDWAEVIYRCFVQPFFCSHVLVDGMVVHAIPMSQAVVKGHIFVFPLMEWGSTEAFSKVQMENV